MKEGVQEVKQNLPEIISDYQSKEERLEILQSEWDESYNYTSKMEDLISQYLALDSNSEEAKRLIKEAVPDAPG